MKLDLDLLFQLIDEGVEEKHTINKNDKISSESSSLKLGGLLEMIDNVENMIPEQASKEQRNKLLKLLIPEIKIPERGTPADTSVVDKFMSSVAGKDPLERMSRLNQLDMTKSGDFSKTGNNLSLLIERISILEYMRSMFNEFQASPLGFVNESFMAVMFGGSKVEVQKKSRSEDTDADPEAEEAHKTVTDMVANGELYSLKTLTPGSKVGGSCDYLARTLSESKNTSVKYLICEKGIVSKQVVNITIYEYVLDSSQLDKITVYAKDKEKVQTFFHKVFKEKKNIIHMGDYLRVWSQKERILNILNQKNKNLQKEDASALTQGINKIPAYRFNIRPQEYKSGRSVTIEFSVEENMDMLEQMVGQALSQVETIHDRLKELVEGLQQYFVITNKERRAQVGKKMTSAAEAIQEPTQQITTMEE